MEATTTIQYDDLYKECTLDYYDGGGQEGSIVYVHGGAWHLGHSCRSRTICTRLSEAGFDVYSVNYRLSSITREHILEVGILLSVPMLLYALHTRSSMSMLLALYVLLIYGVYSLLPDRRKDEEEQQHVHDVTRAMVYVLKMNGDRPFYVAGNSAGGHLVSLIATCPKYLERYGVSPHDEISGVCSVSGVYSDVHVREDYIGGNTLIRSAFGLSRDLRESFPIYSASYTVPPFLLLNAEHDYGLQAQTRDFCAALRGVGAYASYHCIKGANHLNVCKYTETADKMIEFFKQCPRREPGLTTPRVAFIKTTTLRKRI